MNHLALQARVSQVVSEVVSERGQKATGRLLGHSGTTIGRWGEDLHAWSGAGLLTLAMNEAAVADAITDMLEQRAALDAAVEVQVRRVVRECAGEIGTLMAAHEDGRIDQSEARENLAGVRHLIDDLRHLEKALMDRARGARL